MVYSITITMTSSGLVYFVSVLCPLFLHVFLHVSLNLFIVDNFSRILCD